MASRTGLARWCSRSTRRPARPRAARSAACAWPGWWWTNLLKQVYDPKHPLADAQGYVSMPNVDPVAETVNMIAASRSYQANVEVLNTAKSLMQKTLTIGQS